MPYRIWRLYPLANEKVESGSRECFLDRLHELVYLGFFAREVLVYLRRYLVICVWLLVFQPDVFHLGLYLIQAQTMGERNEYEHRLAQDFITLVFWHEFNRATVVQAVSQFYQHDADIIVESEQNTFEILGLQALCVHFILAAVLVVQHILNLREPVHKAGDFVAEKIPYVVNCVVCVFDNVVQQGGRNGFIA